MHDRLPSSPSSLHHGESLPALSSITAYCLCNRPLPRRRASPVLSARHACLRRLRCLDIFFFSFPSLPQAERRSSTLPTDILVALRLAAAFSPPHRREAARSFTQPTEQEAGQSVARPVAKPLLYPPSPPPFSRLTFSLPLRLPPAVSSTTKAPTLNLKRLAQVRRCVCVCVCACAHLIPSPLCPWPLPPLAPLRTCTCTRSRSLFREQIRQARPQDRVPVPAATTHPPGGPDRDLLGLSTVPVRAGPWDLESSAVGTLETSIPKRSV